MKNGIITAPQPEAVEAGADVLAAGGNAIDAAVACALVQTAVDPFMCGIAGFGSMQIYIPDNGTHTFIDFHGRAPASVRPDMWEDLIVAEAEDGFGFSLKENINEIGYQSITTPMTLKALSTALERHGTRSLSELIEPAIAYCEEGFLVRPHVAGFWNEKQSSGRLPHREFCTRYPGAREIYAKPNGDIYAIGDRIINRDMGQTYRRIAENGAVDFYAGHIAAEIVADMQANGGLISAADLEAVAPVENEPLRGTYRGFEYTTNQPPGGGIMLVEMLNILENFDLASMEHNSPAYITTVAEAMKIATIDKDNKVGDPEFFDVPVEELTAKAYAAERADQIRRGEKANVVRMNNGKQESKDTTQICVVDRAGNIVSMTHSIGAPSGVVTKGLGFMYNGCMAVFDPRPGRAGSLAPGKARFTAMCPTILFRNGEATHVIGAPGGTFITMGVLQGILNMVDFGMSAPEAVAAPRFCVTSNTIDITNRILRKTESALVDMDYPVRRSALTYYFAGVHALRRTPSGWEGGADPGRDGMSISV
jgi:gamma-glutamyltranspeptidase/glutathione hydrolase